MSENQNILIQVDGLSISLGGSTVLEDVTFQVAEGEFVYLIGKTGSGKSSLLKTFYGDLLVSDGVVTVNSYSLDTANKKQIPSLRRDLGIVFQEFELLKDRTIRDNLFFVMRALGIKGADVMEQKANELLMKVGLTDVLDKMPHQLSGGEQQRAAIARSLINDPVLILADEPTGNLDPVISREILRLFVELNQQGATVIMATHNHNFLKDFPSRVIYCDEGKIRDLSKEQVLQRLGS